MNAKDRKARPIEYEVMGLQYRAEWARQLLFGLKNLGEEVDPRGLCELKTNEVRAISVLNLETLKDDLAKERIEFVRAEREKDEWASPSCVDGWLCPDSPTGVCVYDEPPNWECCDYCGFPDERK